MESRPSRSADDVVLPVLNSPVSEGNIAVTMLQLSNVAWEVKRDLHLDPKDGHIQGDAEAMKLWGREYEKGWEPHV